LNSQYISALRIRVVSPGRIARQGEAAWVVSKKGLAAMPGRDQFTSQGEAWTEGTFLASLGPAVDRPLAARLFELNKAMPASYRWFGSCPGGAVFLHPGGLKYSPLRVLSVDGALMGQGTWTTYRDIRNHQGFAEMVSYVGQDHDAPPSRFVFAHYAPDELWRIVLRCASAINGTTTDKRLSGIARPAEFDEELFQLINRIVGVGDVVTTLGMARPNRVSAIDGTGLWVETEKSIRDGKGPKLVPAWMINAGWQHLEKHGRLSQAELLDDLNVKRSAFVCALLARFPGVDVGDEENIVLHFGEPAGELGIDDPSVLRWPTVRQSNDPEARPYTATGREGKVNVRHFRSAMTHAMDVDGLVWSFFPSAEEAQVHVDRKIVEGHDSIVVPAKPYVPSERPLPVPEGRAVRPTSGGGGDRATWPGSAAYAARLNYLFDTARAADGGLYTSGGVAELLQGDGLAVHSDSIDRLRAGTGNRPSVGVSSALAFFFDVDPDYFFDQSEEDTAEEHPVSVADGVRFPANGVSDFQLSQAQFVRVLAGLTQATSRGLEAQTVDQQLANRLALIITDAGGLMLESMSGEVLVPARLVKRIMTTWEETNPTDNGTESDYKWAADTFRTSTT
jgi:hypothetical protein